LSIRIKRVSKYRLLSGSCLTFCLPPAPGPYGVAPKLLLRISKKRSKGVDTPFHHAAKPKASLPKTLHHAGCSRMFQKAWCPWWTTSLPLLTHWQNILFADNSNVFPANGHLATHLEPTFSPLFFALNLDISVQLMCQIAERTYFNNYTCFVNKFQLSIFLIANLLKFDQTKFLELMLAYNQSYHMSKFANVNPFPVSRMYDTPISPLKGTVSRDGGWGKALEW
jgi:hypothetical protein